MNGSSLEARVVSSSPRIIGLSSFCAVRGEVKGHDPLAAPVRFSVNLPSPWNGKAVQFGGAVFDGLLKYSDGRKQPTIGLKDSATPLARGYATYGSDSGHHPKHAFMQGIISLFNARFASNVEQQNNFIKTSLKTTHDCALELMKRYYGEGPSRSFFLGSSSGGHEALEVVQNWPDDYDGVMSGYPSWNGTELALQFLRTSKALYTPGGFLSSSNIKLLARSVLRDCDALDGVRDGLVSNPAACHFDPATLLCTAKKQKGCLSSQQLSTVQVYASEQRTSFSMAHGVDSMPGYNVLSGAALSPLMLGLFHHAQRHPHLLFNSVTYTIADRAMQHFVNNGEPIDGLSVDTMTGDRYQAKLQEVSKSYDASETDLSRFAAHGGKLLLIHGTADVVIPTDSTVMYYRLVQGTMGPTAVEGFLRLYLIPGFGHGTGTFNAGVDALGLLDEWVGTGHLPDGLVVTDNNRHKYRRTRPMCAYPSWPEYKGNGDMQDAGSFTCAAPSPLPTQHP